MKDSITIDLPFPPSVNSIWRGSGKRVYRTKEYISWLTNANGHWLLQRSSMPVRSIPEHYSLKLILHAPDKLIRDVGNYEKVSSDFLQMARIVRNDCLCLDLHVVWGSSADAPHGARMIVSPMELEGTY